MHRRVPRAGVASAIALLASLTAQAQPEPTATAYFYDAAGRRDVTVAADEFVVRLAPGAFAAGERPALLGAAPDTDRVPPAALELEQRLASRGVFVARGVAADDLLADPAVATALPVLYRIGSAQPIYQTSDIVVAFHDDVPAARIAQLADQYGCVARQRERGANRYTFTVLDASGANVLTIANALHEQPDLTRYAQPDFILPKVAYTPPVIDDPLYHTLQWHLDGDTTKGAAAGTDIDAEDAWDSANGPNAQGSPKVRIAIQDECVEMLHPDLFPNWAAGRDYDPEPDDDDPSPDGGQRHGTACAGVAVAKGNTIGVRGACPDCGLIGVKFFGGTIAELADSYYFCMDPDNDGDHRDGAAVLSNSWGFADGTLLPSDMLTAINTVATTGRNGKGVLILFASANNDHTINGVSALAQIPTVVAVGGTNSNGEHTEFSDVGPELALAAPTNDRGDDGVRQPWLDITTVDNTGSSGYNGIPDNLDYTNAFGGTSSATPLAAGVLGLILSQDPNNMYASQALAIAQHTSIRFDEPFNRHDAITGHSHRVGFGRINAGAAAAAASAGIRWPGRVKSLAATQTGGSITLNWPTPPHDYATSLLVRSTAPFAWAPTDGVSYTVGQEVAPGVEVVYNGAGGAFIDAAATDGAFFYGVYARSAADRYGFGARAHVIRDAFAIFSDNLEQPDPGWTHGGPGDEWQRGTPTSANGLFGQVVVGSGPLRGTAGTRAIGGDTCWGTDLASTYNAFADAWLQTPLINLGNVDRPVFLEYYDWCMLETGFDSCSIEIVDAGGQLLGTLVADTGGDYDWTRRIHDLSAYAGQVIRIRFRLTSDDTLQRDGWFLDNIRVLIAGNVDVPPVASDIYAETPADTTVGIILKGSDANVGQAIDYVIESLPAHGALSDPRPGGGPIDSVPYTLLDHAGLVVYTPAGGYQGPDQFSYSVTDTTSFSNLATVDVSVGTPVLAYDFPLSISPGWLFDGNWEFGAPGGQDGDPTTAFTGLTIYGYNLDGAYGNNIGAEYLTTLPINCTNLSRVTLEFARWLCVEASSWDSAAIEVTTDGVHWETVWNHVGDTLEDTAWTVQSYNLEQLADDAGFVQFRWRMGPTDSADTFCGWNIDDVRIRAIGTPVANQPPLAVAGATSTAEGKSVGLALTGLDGNGDPVAYIVESLPAGGALSDPNLGPVAAAPFNTSGRRLTYAPDPNFSGIDTFTWSVTDGQLGSNIATFAIDVIEVADFPLIEDFESGALAGYWRQQINGTGRIRVSDQFGPQGGFHAILDSSRESSYARNELDLVVDLEGAAFVRLQFDWREYSDEPDALPATWTGSVNGDGVAISADGVTWHRIVSMTPDAPSYRRETIDLDQAVASAGIAYTSAFRIRFQQYDNNPVDVDGIAIDNVELIQGTSDPIINTSGLASAFVNEFYGPVQLEVLGGDAPLNFSVLDIYGEEDRGGSDFAEVGVARGWNGGDVVFDYTLPFAFPFYGQPRTEVKIASDGWINFGPYVGAVQNNSELVLAANPRIAVLWDNLRTDNGGDILIDESVPGQVTIRWRAITHSGFLPANFSATLYADGRVRCHYGAGNTSLTPTVGVSSGDGVNYTLSGYDGAAALTNANTIEFDLSRLPVGLSLTPGGELSGTPLEIGRFKPIFHVSDAMGRTDQRLLVLNVVPDRFGDSDSDGDVDFDDFDAFVGCMDFPPPDAACLETFDDNADGNINLSDMGRFQVEFTGPLP